MEDSSDLGSDDWREIWGQTGRREPQEASSHGGKEGTSGCPSPESFTLQRPQISAR